MGEILRNRPLLGLAIAFVLGLSFREYPWNLAFAIALFFVRVRPTTVILGLLVGVVLSPTVPKVSVDRTRFVESRATVRTVPRLYPDRIAYELDLQGHRVTLSEPLGSDRSLGDDLYVSGLLRPLREGSERYQLARGIVGRFEPVKVERIRNGPRWHREALVVRGAFVNYTKALLPIESAAMLDALCFNVEGGLSQELTDNLRTSGTIHIISASGLHVLILAVVLDFLLGILPIPRSMRIGILGLLLAFYATAAGLQPAIIRSVLMAMVSLTAYMWQREADLLSALSLSAIGYLLWEPLGIYNIGFQISFLTVGSFALFGRIQDSFPKTAKSGFKEKTLEALRTTNIAYFATLPLLMYYFGSISLMAIPANVIIVPMVIILVIAGMFGFLVSPFLLGFSQAIADFILLPISNLLTSIIQSLGSLPISNLPVFTFSGYWLVPIYALVLMMVRERVRPV